MAHRALRGRSPLAPPDQSGAVLLVSWELPHVKLGHRRVNWTPHHSSSLVGILLTTYRAQKITLKNRMVRGTKQKAKIGREN